MSAEPRGARPGRVVLIGLGNRLRGDDAIGPIIGELVLERVHRLDAPNARSALELHCGSLDALAILAAWSDAAVAIVIDAAVSGHPPGTLHRVELSDGSPGALPLLPASLARASSHAMGLVEAIGLGRAIDRLPRRLVCYAIEAQAFEHAQHPSAKVRKAMQTAVARIADEIVATWHHRYPPPPATCGG